MRRYLRETWSIWYWSLFRPDILQQRLNELAPRTNEDGSRADSRLSDVFFASTSSRFALQHFFLVLCLSSPLLIVFAAIRNVYELLLLVAIFLCCYACSFISFRFGTVVPTVMVFLYLAQTEKVRLFLEHSWNTLPSLNATGLGIAVITLTFWFARLTGESLSEHGKASSPGRRNNFVAIVLGVLVAAAGGVAVGFVMLWLTDFSPLVIAVNSFLYFLWLGAVLFVRRSAHTRDNDDALPEFAFLLAVLGMVVAALCAAVFVLAPLDHYGIGNVILLLAATIGALILSFSFLHVVIFKVLPERGPARQLRWLVLTFVLVAFILWVASILAVGTTSVLAVVVSLPVLSFFLVTLFVAAVVSPPNKNWRRFFFLTAILTPLGFLGLGWVALLTPLVALLGYCRIFPDYAVFCFIAALGVARFGGQTNVGLGRLLKWLPPNLSSLVWLQIPAHDKVLVDAFNYNPEFAVQALHTMQLSPFPSLKATADKALPQIVADRLKAVTTVKELLSIVSISESPLRTVLPQYYQANTPQRPVDQDAALSKRAESLIPEISIIFPHLRTLVQDVNVALRHDRPSMRETALINCKDDLNTFDRQLSIRGYEGTAGKRWRAVSRKWQQILDDEIRSQQSQAFQDIRNPFQPGKPLKPDRPHLFKGRTNFVRAVQRQILEPSHRTILLHGPRQCGKTSFLNYLPTLLGSRVIAVSIDLQLEVCTNSDADLFFKICSLTEAQAIQQGLKLSSTVTRDEFVADTYPAFDAWLNRTSALFRTHHILLCFDEFEELGTAYEESRLTPRAFNQLRHLIQHSDFISLLLAGMRTLDEVGPHWSSHFINAYTIKMLYLESDEAKKLLIDPSPNFQLKYEEGIVERVLSVTRNHPLLIHLLGDMLVNQANEARTRIITQRLLNNAIAQALEASPYFSNIWNELTGTTREEIRFGREVLAAIARNSTIPRYGQSVCQAALQRLQRFHVIERADDGFRIEVPLFKEWVLSHGVIDS